MPVYLQPGQIVDIRNVPGYRGHDFTPAVVLPGGMLWFRYHDAWRLTQLPDPAVYVQQLATLTTARIIGGEDGVILVVLPEKVRNFTFPHRYLLRVEEDWCEYDSAQVLESDFFRTSEGGSPFTTMLSDLAAAERRGHDPFMILR